MCNLQTRYVPSLWAKRMGEFTLQISSVFTILKCLVYTISIVLTLARKLTRDLTDSNILPRLKLFTDQIYKVVLQMSVSKLHLHSLTKHHTLQN